MPFCLGIPWWTTDIGGFSGGNPKDPAFRQLLVRWFQWGTFCPVMRLHGDRVPACRRFAPEGAWTLIYDGTRYEGGRTVTVAADIGRIPVFLRENRHAEWIGSI